MGCNMSKQHTIAHVDDSVRVMLSHESKIAKKKGVATSTTYIPRAEHPLFSNQNATTTPTTDAADAAAVDTTPSTTVTKPSPSSLTASTTTDGTATTEVNTMTTTTAAVITATED